MAAAIMLQCCHPPGCWPALQRSRTSRPGAAAAAAAPAAGAFLIEAACCVNKAVIGLNPQGYRGLLAAADIAPGDVVLRIPLSNMLQVPRQLTDQPGMQQAAASALHTWQQQHSWQLPAQLVSFLVSTDAVWEAKLVAWLLYLRTAAPKGSLWASYCSSLPSAEEAITFCSYSEQQAEQLQLSTWKNLADKQRQLLETVQQQCESAGLQQLLTPPPASDSSSSSRADQPDYAWALSMVKSRTFGQKLPAGPSSSTAGQAAAPGAQPPLSGLPAAAAAAAAAAAPAAAAAAAAAAAQELEEDDSGVFLLMAPFIDMINHAPDNNCVFGIDPDASSFSVRCSSRTGIPCGQEVTISYGSNKSNLALLSCYGFQIPGNPNDEQLLSPILKSSLAAAGNAAGFPVQLLQQASAQHAAAAAGQDAGAAAAGAGHALLQPDLAAARRRCALASLPAAAPEQEQAVQQQQQQQRYLAQLMLYTLGLIFKLCGTSIAEDLQQLSQGSSGSSKGGLDAAILQQAVLARLEQKLLLRECEGILQQVLRLLE